MLGERCAGIERVGGPGPGAVEPPSGIVQYEVVRRDQGGSIGQATCSKDAGDGQAVEIVARVGGVEPGGVDDKAALCVLRAKNGPGDERPQSRAIKPGDAAVKNAPLGRCLSTAARMRRMSEFIGSRDLTAIGPVHSG